MVILRIQHPVPGFDAWKRAFDQDPADRRGSGVLRYRIQRPIDDPAFVAIELEFNTPAEAHALLEKMRHIWASGGAPIAAEPEAWIVDTVESRDLA
jgi:hypothetical protein